MICPICNQRYADFPPEDFEYDSEKGETVIKSEGAEKRRAKEYESDEERVCPDCQNEEVEIQSARVLERYY